ncbi:MAG: MIP/aquaporin family protein [Bacilli bacterium]
MDKIIIGELIGTCILIIFGLGTCAANALNKSYAKGSGWVFIVFGWGLGVFAGIIVSAPLSGAHLNPAVSLSFLLQETITLPEFLAYVGAQLAGAFIGAFIVYQLYYDHFVDSMKDGPLGGVFFTGPAIPNRARNFASEIVGTFILVLFILMLAKDAGANSLFVPFLVVGVGIALGSLTGYAINPARDLGPRLFYSLTQLNKDGSANWGYAIVPIVGPLLGSALATLVYMTLLK